MTQLNFTGETTVAALLALLDAAAALVALPADVRRQTIGRLTIQHLLDDAKALDRALTDDLHGNVQPQRHEARAEEPTAQNAPERPQSKPRPPKTPASPRTPVLPPVFAATAKDGEAKDAEKRGETRIEPIDLSAPMDADPRPTLPEADAHPSGKLPFAEFDQLVRAEMKRLSMDGRLPGHKLWNNERDPRLPTMAAVILRYGTTTLADLAPKFGLQPPLSVAKEGKS